MAVTASQRAPTSPSRAPSTARPLSKARPRGAPEPEASGRLHRTGLPPRASRPARSSKRSARAWLGPAASVCTASVAQRAERIARVRVDIVLPKLCSLRNHPCSQRAFTRHSTGERTDGWPRSSTGSDPASQRQAQRRPDGASSGWRATSPPCEETTPRTCSRSSARPWRPPWTAWSAAPRARRISAASSILGWSTRTATRSRIPSARI